MPLFPDVRTLREAGIDLEVNSPYGVCGPKGMDPAIVKKVHNAMKDALFDPVDAGGDEHLQHADALSRHGCVRQGGAGGAQNQQSRSTNLKRVGMLAKG